jgi:hypothetical protein
MAVFATAGRPIAVREYMPWNEADRERYNIVRERYTSDLSDEEYALIEPLLPQPKRRGRKPTPARTILNAIFYLARCACPWRYMPKDFPPYTTVQNRFINCGTVGF